MASLLMERTLVHDKKLMRSERTVKPTAIYRNPSWPDLPTSFAPDTVRTMYDLFAHGLKVSPRSPCLGSRITVDDKFVWQTYVEISNRIDHFGSGLAHLIASSEYLDKKNIKNNTPIGIWSANRPEWTITDLACASQGLFSVALYETLGLDSVKYIICHAELEIIVCASKYVHQLIEYKEKLLQLSVIIAIDDDMVSEGDKILAAKQKITLLSFSEVEKIGLKNPRSHKYPETDDLACIMYTSGTTGVPKGVMLTHGNFVAACTATVFAFGTDANEIGLSYLPLAHCFGRIYDLTILCSGGRLGYVTDGDPGNLIDDCQSVQPTMFVAVPRLLNRIYSQLAHDSIFSEGHTGQLSRIAVEDKIRSLKNGNGFEHPVWDELLFNKLKQFLGGKIRVIGSGAAPLSPDVLQFLRVCLCCDIREGYGATETTAASCLQKRGDSNVGSVGNPYACNEIKLVDVSEMDCFTTTNPPKGEICMRGPNIFKGYYKEEALTKSVLDKDGWYHSGDIGTIDEEGNIKVIDRKKNIFKLSQGEYIAPEKIENVYVKTPIISQIFIYGDSHQNSLVSVVVPDTIEIVKIARDLGFDASVNVKQLCLNHSIKNAILKRLLRDGKAAGLQGFELPKAIHIEIHPFTIENNLLTPTLKLKRSEAKQRYRHQINDMYNTLNSTSI